MDAARAGLDEWLRHAWSQTPETWQIEVEGTSIACRSWNRGATDRPPILLAHGFRAHARWWDHIAPALMEGRHVVAFDLSGMGDSGWRPAYARLQFAREMLAVAAALDGEKPIVVAHSFGGMITLLACGLAPDFARRLILIDSALPTATGNGQILETPPRIYADQKAAVSRYRLRPPGRWPDPTVLTYVSNHSVMPTQEGWRWKFDPNAARSLNLESDKDVIAVSQLPADFIHGDRSEIMNEERIALVRRLLPRCGEPVVIPACHHHVPIEQPVALVAALHALLANDKD